MKLFQRLYSRQMGSAWRRRLHRKNLRTNKPKVRLNEMTEPWNASAGVWADVKIRRKQLC